MSVCDPWSWYNEAKTRFGDEVCDETNGRYQVHRILQEPDRRSEPRASYESPDWHSLDRVRILIVPGLSARTLAVMINIDDGGDRYLASISAYPPFALADGIIRSAISKWLV